MPALQTAVMLYFADLSGQLPPECEGERKSSRWALPSRLRLLRTLKVRVHQLSRVSNRALCAMVLPLNAIADLRTSGRDAVYHSRQLALNWSCAFVILLTFGVACPTLAVVVLLHISLSSLSMQLCISRHHDQARALGPVALKRWGEVLLHEVRDRERWFMHRYALALSHAVRFILLHISVTGG